MADISKMETNTTAVEWLHDELTKTWYDKKNSEELLKQAKQMEKEQIIKAFFSGQETPLKHPILPHYSGKEYYEETYNK